MTISTVTNRVQILKEKFTQSVGLPFQELLPQSLIEQALSELSIKYKTRLFDPVVTLWAFLSQVLDVDKSCHNVVSRIIAWLSSQKAEIPSSDTSAYCQARKRLPEKLVDKLFRESGKNLETLVNPKDLWCGRHVQIIDGSTVSMPDTESNQSSYPQSSKQKPGCGFPIAKIGALFSLTTCAVTAAVIDVLNTHDVKLAQKLYEFLSPGDILLGDSAFHSYGDFHRLVQMGCDAVIRKNNARLSNFTTELIINKLDRIVVWHKPKKPSRTMTQAEFNLLPDTLTVREISYSINIPGFRSSQVTIITTLLDTSIYTTDAIIQLYRERWHVELNLRHLKTTLGMDVLRCKTPDLIRKEIYVYLLAYNLIRSLMWSAANTYGAMPTHLSLQATRHHFNNFIHQFSFVDDKFRQHLYLTLLKVIVHKSVPQRPNRVEPRVVKRRPKAYGRMTKTRRLLRIKLVAA
jgi:Transposase DDE domain/Insertion element 4 transposase N-terminal